MPEVRQCRDCLNWEQEDGMDGMDGNCWVRVHRYADRGPSYMRGDEVHRCVDFEPREATYQRCANCAHWQPRPDVYNSGLCPLAGRFWPGYYGISCRDFLPRHSAVRDTFAPGVFTAE